MANQLKTRYDIIINGGGIVGFTLLNLILKSPHLSRCKVLLIEQGSRPSNLKQPNRIINSSSNSVSEQTTQEPLFSNRVSSITRRSRNILEKLGVWSQLQQYAKDVKTINVWNSKYTNKIVFSQDDYDLSSGTASKDVMFSVVENNRLALSLLNKICQNNEHIIKWDNNLIGLNRSNDGILEITTKNIKSDSEYKASAPLILGCDGFKSKVREYAHMNYKEFSLNKTALVGTVKLDPNMVNNTNETAYQRFSSEHDTVAALLPLDENYSSFVISAPDNYAKELIECDNDKFVDQFNRLLSADECETNTFLSKVQDITNFGYTTMAKLLDRNPSFSQSDEVNFGNVDAPKVISVVDNSRAMFPLLFGTTTPKMIASLEGKKYPEIALLGDSSHRIHPLAGQGLNLGIQDAEELVDQLEIMMKCGEKVFDDNDASLLAKVLKRYEINRQKYIIPMSVGILSMPYLFRLAPPSLISVFDRMNCIKREAVKFANG